MIRTKLVPGITPLRAAGPVCVLACALLLAAVPVQAGADPLVKAFKQGAAETAKATRQVAAASVKDLRERFQVLLDEVEAGTTTPGDALDDAVDDVCQVVAQLSTGVLGQVATVRDGFVGLAAAEGPVSLGRQFQRGGRGLWDGLIDKTELLLDKADDGVEKELGRFVSGLTKLVKKAGGEIDVHVQYREHDARLYALEGPAVLAASPTAPLGFSIVAQPPHVLVEARIAAVGLSVTSEIGILAFDQATVDLDYVTDAGTTSVTGVPVAGLGIARHTQTVNLAISGPLRIDVQPSVDGPADQIGMRQPSLFEIDEPPLRKLLGEVRKQSRKNLRFFDQKLNGYRGQLKTGQNNTRKAHAKGQLNTHAAVLKLFSNLRLVLGRMNVDRGQVLGNTAVLSIDGLDDLNVTDLGIPDDFAAYGGGFYQRFVNQVDRRYAVRWRSFTRITSRVVDRILARARKQGVNAAATVVFSVGRRFQGPLVTTYPVPVLQRNVAAHINIAGMVLLEQPEVLTSILVGQTPDLGGSVVETIVALPSGQSIVVPGIVSGQGKVFEKRVPMTGDVPLRSRVFMVGESQQVQNSLVLLVSPSIPGSD